MVAPRTACTWTGTGGRGGSAHAPLACTDALSRPHSYRIPLRENKRHPDEAAVLTTKQWPGNRNALLWIPGRNDGFFHVHVLERILEAGFDLVTLDLRRCGRAQFSRDGARVVPELLAHDSHDFRSVVFLHPSAPP